MKTEDIDKLIGMPDVDKEWEKFCFGMYSRKRRIAAIIVAVFSLSLVGAAAVLVYNTVETRTVADGGIKETTTGNNGTVPTKNIENPTDDSLPEAFIFDNVEMQDIAKAIGNHYNVKTEFKNEKAKHVRLYLQIDKEKSLEEVVELLNNFHKLHFTLDGETLLIE